MRRRRDAEDARSFTIELTGTGERNGKDPALCRGTRSAGHRRFLRSRTGDARQLLGKLYSGLDGDREQPTDDRLAG